MATYVIVYSTDITPTASEIEKLFPGSRQWNERTFIVQAPDVSAKALTLRLSEATGLKRSLFVCRLSADYYGYSKIEFWNWLSASFAGESNE
ncbi:hypothetical protein [Sphingomonas sp.]|uniref:hypothetical protein n=1 Tax=Sphingomonas sp. TaxID=28214 RepID=UPI0025F41E42|nr:hypothetical protein [Sphingomonas sp.]